MDTLTSVLEAKNYLVTRIASEADHDGNPLMEVERKIMYFTESGVTIPDMEEISEAFDRDYVQSDYEIRIGSLIQQARARALNESEGIAAWNRAVQILEQGDHYLLVLLRAAPVSNSSLWLDRVKLLVAAIFCIAVLGLIVYLTKK